MNHKKTVNKNLEIDYDSTSYVDQTITANKVYEKFIAVKNNEAVVLLFEYTKLDYGTGFKISKFELKQ